MSERGDDNMPERIWAGDFDSQGFGHCVAGMQGGLYAEYVRADLYEALRQQSETARAWPADAEYQYGDPVEKFTGEAIWRGRIVSAYLTTAGKLRYVVDVEPQGFQMIAVPSMLRALKSGERGS